MEWLILFLLVPAILVPVVLLCGFAGCGFNPSGASIAKPTVTATPKNVDHITVSWQNADSRPALNYHFVRKLGDVIQTDVDEDASITTVEDTGLEAETDYTYEVSTITAAGSSDAAPVTAGTFKMAFDASADAPTVQTIVGAGDFTFVQRIIASQLLASGGQLALKVRGAPSANVTIHRIYVSRAAASGNLWDAAADLTPVMTSDLTLPDDQPVDLDPIAYNLDQTQDLLIAFDFSSTATAGNIRFVHHTGVTLFFKEGVQQAATPIRDVDYTSSGADPTLYLVVTIGGL